MIIALVYNNYSCCLSVGIYYNAEPIVGNRCVYKGGVKGGYDLITYASGPSDGSKRIHEEGGKSTE